MENKTIDIEPRAAVEMQTWKNIYDRVPSQYKQVDILLKLQVSLSTLKYCNQIWE